MSDEFHCQHCAQWIELDFGIYDALRDLHGEAGSVTQMLPCPRCGGETPLTVWQGEVQTIENPKTIDFGRRPKTGT